MIRVSLYLLASVALNTIAEPLPWNNKAAAVSLSYDDALNVHIDKVAPALEKRKLRGTFYIAGHSEAFRTRIDEWRKMAGKGHELGNHTLYHPCNGEGNDWLHPEWDLRKWSVKRISDNVLTLNTLLHAVDGQTKRTFAFTCGDTMASGKPFFPSIQENFVAARGVSGYQDKLEDVDLSNLSAFAVYQHTGEDLIAQVDKAIEEKAWLIFLFHGVGGEHPMNITEKEHNKLLDYLKKHKKSVWVEPVLGIGAYVKENR